MDPYTQMLVPFKKLIIPLFGLPSVCSLRRFFSLSILFPIQTRKMAVDQAHVLIDKLSALNLSSEASPESQQEALRLSKELVLSLQEPESVAIELAYAVSCNFQTTFFFFVDLLDIHSHERENSR